MSVSLSKLRANIYQLLDHVLETGEPLIVERKGRRLRIIAEDPAPSRLARLVPRPEFLKCAPEDLVHVDWSDTWKP